MWLVFFFCESSLFDIIHSNIFFFSIVLAHGIECATLWPVAGQHAYTDKWQDESTRLTVFRAKC